LWRCPVGDVLQQAPKIVGEHLLLVSKSNKILLAERATGAVKQEVSWPTWILSTAIASNSEAPRLACTDLAGMVTVLSLTDLQQVQKVSLDVDLAGPLLFASEMPLKWPVLKADVNDENLISE